MHLAKLIIENFRIFGSKVGKEHLDLTLQPGLTLLVGENDSGKTAVVDALRLVLGTTSHDYVRVGDDDFHKSGKETAKGFTIYCRFEGLDDDEAARFLEWLSLEEGKPVLELTLRAKQTQRRNKRGVPVPFVEFTTNSGPDGQGRAFDGVIRSYLWLTYLKPLRDAEMEMTPGKGSRLSQLLISHPALEGEDKVIDMPLTKAGEPSQPPGTLRGIMKQAEEWIAASPAITEAQKQLNEEYFQNLSVGSDKLRGEIAISRETDLRGILEKLELLIAAGDPDTAHTRHGLGLNNILFMAAELLLLNESGYVLPLLLIEEPEAHLHPQLQLRLMEFLARKIAENPQLQVLLTTHSPNLSSAANIQNVVLFAKGHAFLLGPDHTQLTTEDCDFLRRFLDTTRANLFFAKGVVLVEGDSENLLLPTIAKLLDRSFTKYGVSVVNVGHRGYFRYSRIFQRKDGSEPPVRVACIVDKDIPPDEACGDRKDGYVRRPKIGKRFQGDFTPDEMAEYESNLRKHRGGAVEVFVSPQWTLEHDLALAGLGRELHQAITLACEHKKGSILAEDKRREVFEAANKGFDGFAGQLSAIEIAVRVYEPLYERRASKAETAQILADILDPKPPSIEKQKSESPAIKLSTSELKTKLPDYLVKAIEHVTEKIPDSNSNAGAT